jgi:hypothetical protein
MNTKNKELWSLFTPQKNTHIINQPLIRNIFSLTRPLFETILDTRELKLYSIYDQTKKQ